MPSVKEAVRGVISRGVDRYIQTDHGRESTGHSAYVADAMEQGETFLNANMAWFKKNPNNFPSWLRMVTTVLGGAEEAIHNEHKWLERVGVVGLLGVLSAASSEGKADTALHVARGETRVHRSELTDKGWVDKGTTWEK